MSTVERGQVPAALYNKTDKYISEEIEANITEASKEVREIYRDKESSR